MVSTVSLDGEKHGCLMNVNEHEMNSATAAAEKCIHKLGSFCFSADFKSR